MLHYRLTEYSGLKLLPHLTSTFNPVKKVEEQRRYTITFYVKKYI
jgi:hypothetical protein